MNNRRKLVIALGASALAAPHMSFAQQQGKVWRVGVLSERARPTSLETDASFSAFLRGMSDLGYVEPKNVVIEWRFGDSKVERLSEMAADLVRSNVDIFVAAGTQSTSAAQKATTTIPIVMLGVADPLASGFVKSLSHPGGNITGQSNLIGDMGPKYLEMLLDFVPRLSRVAMLVHPTHSGHAAILKRVEVAAQKRGVKLLRVAAQTVPEIANAFALMAKEKSQAFIVANDTFFNTQKHQIASLAVKNRLPSIAASFAYAEAGGLMSYGISSGEQYRRTATYVDKILKGAKPGDLPVEQPTKFELIINGKTAKALGLKIPQSLLISADKVIE